MENHNEEYYSNLIDFYQRMRKFGIDDIKVIHNLAIELGLSDGAVDTGFLWTVHNGLKYDKNVR